jgi:hypothetical protein
MLSGTVPYNQPHLKSIGGIEIEDGSNSKVTSVCPPAHITHHHPFFSHFYATEYDNEGVDVGTSTMVHAPFECLLEHKRRCLLSWKNTRLQ